MKDEDYSWSEDKAWTAALNRYFEFRREGVRSVTIDIEKLDKLLANDALAYELADAMASVLRHEGWDGHRGAPRLVFALMARLVEKGVAETS